MGKVTGEGYITFPQDYCGKKGEKEIKEIREIINRGKERAYMEAKLIGGPYLGVREEYRMKGQEKLFTVIHIL
jgi:hypothetical protein